MSTRNFGSEFVARLAERADAHRRRAAEIVHSLSHQELHLRPADGGWSVAECLEHLSVTARAYVQKIDPVLNRAVMSGYRRQGCDFQPSGMAKWFIRAVGPQSKKKYKAPARFRVRARDLSRNAFQVLAEFDAAGQAIRVCLHRGGWLDLSKHRVQSPAAAWLRLPAGSMLLALLAHEERHLDQAQRAADLVRGTAASPA